METLLLTEIEIKYFFDSAVVTALFGRHGVQIHLIQQQLVSVYTWLTGFIIIIITCLQNSWRIAERRGAAWQRAARLIEHHKQAQRENARLASPSVLLCTHVAHLCCLQRPRGIDPPPHPN